MTPATGAHSRNTPVPLMAIAVMTITVASALRGQLEETRLPERLRAGRK